jgi:hypothetical protein
VSVYLRVCAFVRVRSRRCRINFTSDDNVVACIRENLYYRSFEQHASFPYTECSCKLCGIGFSRQPNPGGTVAAKTCSGYTDGRLTKRTATGVARVLASRVG